MSSLISAIIAASIMIPLLLNLILMVVIALRVRNQVDSQLSRCSVVIDHKAIFLGLGIMGDVVRIGVIGIILIFPKPFLRRGVVDSRQIDGLPVELKLLIIIPWVTNVVCVIALFAFRFYLYMYDINPLG